jgi:pimeloyl-ACP methyl ester carboxylesterase
MTHWVLLRGLTREARHWGAFSEALRVESPGAEVTALDLPGNGRLNQMRSPLSVPAMREHCRAQLASAGAAPPYHLLAMSLGAMVAIDWAANRPQELAGCVLINTSLRTFSPIHQRLRPRRYATLLRLLAPGLEPRRREAAVLALTSRHRDTDSALLEAWVAWRREAPVSRANALRQLLAAARFRAPRQAPVVPLLVLAGAGDALVDPRCSMTLARRWGCRIAIHPSAGHDLPLDDPDWVVREVAAWRRGA